MKEESQQSPHRASKTLAKATKTIKTIGKYLATPAKKYPVFFIFLLLLLTCVTIYTSSSDLIHIKFIWRVLRIIVPELIFVEGTCCLYLLTAKINKQIERSVIIFTHLFLYACAALDCFLILFYKSHFNILVLQLVMQTNPNEASNFATSILLTPKMLLVVGYVVFFGILEYLCWRNLGKIKSHIKQKSEGCYQFIRRTFTLGAIMAALLASYGALTELDVNTTKLIPEKLSMVDESNNVTINVVRTLYQYVSDNQSYEECVAYQEGIKIDTCSFRSPNIILVIGESYIKHHSSLYGYPKNTNPFLSLLPPNNLRLFQNAVTPYNSTFMVMQQIMSFSCIGDDSQWYQSPFFPCVFKAAGYNVVYWSNQFVNNLNMNFWDAPCVFFYHPAIEPKMFTARNTQTYTYDGQLIDAYKEQRSSLEKDSMSNLIIFHLMGQHLHPASSFPAEEAFFTTQDYDDRKELGEKEKAFVADYDNATRYNDSVVAEIIKMYHEKDAILIYFSDHGEEAYDFRDNVGRTPHLDELGAPAIHCQMDVPFFVYMSDSYRSNHPDVAERVDASVLRPLKTDDLPHLLLDLAGIKIASYLPQRSVINDAYDLSRKRLVADWGAPYDYDSICTPYGPWVFGWAK